MYTVGSQEHYAQLENIFNFKTFLYKQNFKKTYLDERRRGCDAVVYGRRRFKIIRRINRRLLIN